MACPLRIEVPGTLYHVTSRGNARQKVCAWGQCSHSDKPCYTIYGWLATQTDMAVSRAVRKCEEDRRNL